MSEWIDVPVADVQTGDEVKVDGIGERGGKAMNLAGIYWNAVTAIEEKEIVLGACEIPNLTGTGYRFRRSSIVSARRRTPEPSPQPGDWRCRVPGTCPECLAACGCISREVFRASGGWSRDTRTGQPWVIKTGVEVVAIGWGYEIGGTENNATAFWGHKYKVTGVDRARSGYWILDCQIIGPHSIHARNLDLVDRRGKR